MNERRFITVEVRAIQQRPELFYKPTELTWSAEFIVSPVEDRAALLTRIEAAIERAALTFPDDPEPSA